MNRRDFISGIGITSIAAALPLESLLADEAKGRVGKVRPKLDSFDYRGVKLLPGRFQRQVEQTRELYFNLPNDDILKGFRRQAGLPAPGKDLKGWASRKCDATFGQWLSGMARLACALNDAALRQKAIELAEGWKQTLPPDGNCQTGTYGWEKLVCGLVDLALYAGYDTELERLEKTMAWAERRFAGLNYLAGNHRVLIKSIDRTQPVISVCDDDLSIVRIPDQEQRG